MPLSDLRFAVETVGSDVNFRFGTRGYEIRRGCARWLSRPPGRRGSSMSQSMPCVPRMRANSLQPTRDDLEKRAGQAVGRRGRARGGAHIPMTRTSTAPPRSTLWRPPRSTYHRKSSWWWAGARARHRNMGTKSDSPNSPTDPWPASIDPALGEPSNAGFRPAPTRPAEEADDAASSTVRVDVGESAQRWVSVPQVPRGLVVASMALVFVLALAFAAGRLTSGSPAAPGRPALGHHAHPGRSRHHASRPRFSGRHARRRSSAPARSQRHRAPTLRSAAARSRPPHQAPAPPAPVSEPQSPPAPPTQPQAEATPPSSAGEEGQTPGGLFSP